MLKTTSLERELSLKIEATRKTEFIKRLEGMGLLEWEVFKENGESINNTIMSLVQRLARYKECRLKFGLFFLAYTQNDDYIVRSHLKHMPLKEARRRSRLDP
ncbi:hypothetical protein PVAP13_7KG371601 [Panicum virgatum]|uniref:Uncharacterized protein n=1 Tax=Panicum virgatum TaxID=38727 RepID=A0A8T0QRV0_PANVG|nr:hypothetical protein PVAP13_7KG371601 [Panicum virgatum]